MGPDELFQRAVIARRYYLEGRTRIQIAEEFGLSRFKVARMLDEALESGMVEITIHNPGSIDVDLSTALQRRYGLRARLRRRRPMPSNTADRVEAVAKAMAELLQSILRDGDVIGVDCGRTLTHIAPSPDRRCRSATSCNSPAWPAPSPTTAPTWSDGSVRSAAASHGRSTRRWWCRMHAPPRAWPATSRSRRPFAQHAKVTLRHRLDRRMGDRAPHRFTRHCPSEALAFLDAPASCAETCAPCCWTPTATGWPGWTIAGWESTRSRPAGDSHRYRDRHRPGEDRGDPGRVAVRDWSRPWSPTPTSRPRCSIDVNPEKPKGHHRHVGT